MVPPPSVAEAINDAREYFASALPEAQPITIVNTGPVKGYGFTGLRHPLLCICKFVLRHNSNTTIVLVVVNLKKYPCFLVV